MWAELAGAVAASFFQEAGPPMGQYGAANDMTQWRHVGHDSAENLRRLVDSQKTKKSTYDCVGCGAPLFGIVNENCQYCKRPARP